MKTILLASAFALTASFAFAQSAGERTGANSTLGVSPSTADFVKEAASSDMYEIQSSQKVQQVGNEKVKAFAGQMITDHTKTSNELKQIATKANVPVPTTMLPTQQKLLDDLSGKAADQLTKIYLDDQVTAHKQAVSLFERYAKGGDNSELKTWAGQTLPTLQHHLQMAQDLDKQVK